MASAAGSTGAEVSHDHFGFSGELFERALDYYVSACSCMTSDRPLLGLAEFVRRDEDGATRVFVHCATSSRMTWRPSGSTAVVGSSNNTSASGTSEEGQREQCSLLFATA